MSRLPQEIAGLIEGLLTTIVPSNSHDDDGWSQDLRCQNWEIEWLRDREELSFTKKT